jgi:hypothetical protein
MLMCNCASIKDFVAKDNTSVWEFVVLKYGWEVFIDNYKIWEFEYHLFNKRKL